MASRRTFCFAAVGVIPFVLLAGANKESDVASGSPSDESTSTPAETDPTDNKEAGNHWDALLSKIGSPPDGPLVWRIVPATLLVKASRFIGMFPRGQ